MLTEERLALFKSCERLALAVARLAYNRARAVGLPVGELADWMQEALLAAWRATARFEAERGVKFVSFCSRAVEGHLAHYRRDSLTLIRIPAPVRDGRTRAKAPLPVCLLAGLQFEELGEE